MSVPIYIAFQLRPASAEITGASVGVIFLRLLDSALGHTLNLSYNHSAGLYEVYTDTGSLIQTSAVPFADTYIGFKITAIPLSDGRINVTVYLQNVWQGQFTTSTPVNYDQLQMGALANIANEPVDHWYRGVSVGTTDGGSDLLNTNNFNDHTVVPPFDGFIGTTFSVTSNQLHVVNDGSVPWAYVEKALQPVFFPPPPPIWINDPGDGTIVVAGNSDWEQAGQPTWQIDNWGMDKLTIPMRGSRRTRDAFLATLPPWMVCPFESNMFLADITQEHGSPTNFPKIDLVFIGKRGGVLPPDKETTGRQIQQVSGRSIFIPTHTLSVWFIAATGEITTWSRQPIDLGSVTAPAPADVDLVWVGETDVVIWAGSYEAYHAHIMTFIGIHFIQETAITGTSEVIVPGQYYRATKTNQNLIYPILT